MDKRFAKNLVAYIQHNNTLLQKYASQVDRFSNFVSKIDQERGEYQVKLAEAIDIMADDGVIPEDYKDAVFNSMKDSPTKAAEFLTKANNSPKKLGGASSSNVNSHRDPIVDFCFS